MKLVFRDPVALFAYTVAAATAALLTGSLIEKAVRLVQVIVQ